MKIEKSFLLYWKMMILKILKMTGGKEKSDNMFVRITKNNMVGSVLYDSKTKKLTVNFPDENVRDEVEKFLTEKHEYRFLTNSGILDDYEEVTEYPTYSEFHLCLRLGTLYPNIHVWVDWDSVKDCKCYRKHREGE